MKHPGPAAAAPLVLAVLLLLPPSGRALTMEEAAAQALANNHRIREFQHRTEAQEERVGSAKAAFWPEASMHYEYTWREQFFGFFQTQDTSTFTATARYNLFNGFSDLARLREARSQLDGSVYELEGVRSDIVLDAKTAFIGILRARRDLEVARESVELLERQRRDAELFFEAGLIAKNDLLEVEVELATVRQDLLSAQRDLRVARQTLERTMGVPLGEDVTVEEFVFVPPLDFDEDALARMMFERRSELRFLEASRRAEGYRKDAIAGEYYPSVDLSVSHFRFGETFAFEGRPDPLFDEDTQATITAEWILFDGFRRRGDIRAAASEIRAIEERIRDTGDRLLLQLRTALADYRVSAGRIDLARKAVEQAEENYRITENQFRERVATTTDLLDARVFLTRARTQFNNAFYGLREALAALERVVEHPLITPEPALEAPGG
jgi:outer membrane protein